jgi:hypothetical protein
MIPYNAMMLTKTKYTFDLYTTLFLLNNLPYSVVYD